MTLDELETTFRFRFPAQHRQDLENRSDPIHQTVEFLYPDDPGILNFGKCNIELRADSWQGWSDQFLAFATQGCGDYYAFDLSQTPYRVFVVDPTWTVAESLADDDASGGPPQTYREWRESVLQIHMEVEEDFVGHKAN